MNEAKPTNAAPPADQRRSLRDAATRGGGGGPSRGDKVPALDQNGSGFGEKVS